MLNVELVTDGSTIRNAKVNTVLLAVGREPNTKVFKNVEGLKFTKSGKLFGLPHELEQSSI